MNSIMYNVHLRQRRRRFRIWVFTVEKNGRFIFHEELPVGATVRMQSGLYEESRGFFDVLRTHTARLL